jgi:hypothetical protein
MRGFPVNTFKNSWTIEFFVYIPGSSSSGYLITSDGSSSIPIGDITYTGADIFRGQGSPGFSVVLGDKQLNGRVACKPGSNGLSGGLDNGNVAYSYGWVSFVIQYDQTSSTNSYSIMVTPKETNSTKNPIYTNKSTNNIGFLNNTNYIQNLIFGNLNYYVNNKLNNPGVKDVYITNLRISNIARYQNTTPGSTPSPAIMWPDNSNYKPDKNTVYFNSFNVPDTSTTPSDGYLLSQIVQIL